jgi:putative colanic acid biosynthesis acetyltransferase WcaF
MLRVFGAKIGKNVRIYPSANISQPWNLEIGDDSTISWSVILYCLGQIRIGSGTIVSQYSSLCAGSHDYTHPSFLLQKEDINISDNVWIASNAFIGPGVVVGSGSVVGACSVVFRNVPPSVLCVGNPSKIIKRLK